MVNLTGKLCCQNCIHAYTGYPYNGETDTLAYCGLHGFGEIRKSFFCASFEVDDTKMKIVPETVNQAKEKFREGIV